jgi:anti-sigma-K factor RskA
MTPGEYGHESGRTQDEVLAGEYVLGVLSAEARRRVEQRMVADKGFALLVERWQSDLSSLNEDYQEESPGAAVYSHIERRLFGVEPSVVATGIWNAASFWRWVALGASTVAVAAIVFASSVYQPSRTPAPIVAQLSAPENPLNLLVSFDAATGRAKIVPVASGAREEKSLQLWFVPESGNPRSLGVFQPGADGELLIPADLRQTMTAGVRIAVSLEPFGGSPTGLPTGPIVASGTTRQL